MRSLTIAETIINMAETIKPRYCHEHYLALDDPLLSGWVRAGIARAGTSRVWGSYLIERQQARREVVIAVETGQLLIAYSDGEQILGAGDIFVAGAGTNWRLSLPPDRQTTCRMFWWYRWPRTTTPQHQAQALLLHPQSQLLLRASAELYRACTLSQIKSPTIHRPHSSPVIPQGSLASCAHLVLMLLQDYWRDTTASRTPLAELIAALSADLSRSWSNQDMAQTITCSVATAQRHCQAAYQMSLGELLHTLRMSQARSLLAHSAHTLDHIADILGYSDAYTFSRAFKRSHGCAPGNWRATQRTFQSGSSHESAAKP